MKVEEYLESDWLVLEFTSADFAKLTYSMKKKMMARVFELNLHC